MSIFDHIRAWLTVSGKHRQFYDADRDPALEEYFEILPEAGIETSDESLEVPDFGN
ncbi:hypothetical protein ASZ90_010067 [hydrocarbon metagenome]|uniref:Uncharacterized protein n=1 Tax=hydrocarbon metagenome TaxID=938273 RepID=A0A0W8FH15_9ZZZZ|nr:hypothetical protein [Methanomicrobiaceae archaeon]